MISHPLTRLARKAIDGKRANNSRAQTPALLKGMIFSENGAAMTPTSTKKGAKLYRYYVSMDVIRNRETGEETAPMRLAA